MPRYAYECFECGHAVEKLEGWDAPAQQPCLRCPELMQRIPSAPAIVFKGKGWYSTDNRKSSWKGRSDEDRGESGADADGRQNGAGGSEAEAGEAGKVSADAAAAAD